MILHTYLVWGDHCPDHLIGDFAFVLWDGRQERLLAARDPLGVAQLFYSQAGGTLLVGNTLHSLLLHPGVPDTLDEKTLAEVALFLVTLDDAATGYSAIRRVPPGHKLTCDRGGLRVERYWTLPRACPPPPVPPAGGVRRALPTSLRRGGGGPLAHRRRREPTERGDGLVEHRRHRPPTTPGQRSALRAPVVLHRVPTLIPDKEARLAAQAAARRVSPSRR